MFQVVDADATFLEALITEQIAVQRCIGFDAGNRQLGKGYAHFRHGLVAVFTDDTDFADQAVVVRRDAIALVDVAVDAATTWNIGWKNAKPNWINNPLF